MPTQKIFKRRVRARAEKTGESYTAARAQLIRRADAHASAHPSTDEAASEARPTEQPMELPTSDDAIRNGTGHDWARWFGLLDAWGATERRHAEIARWLREEHGVDSWWAQSVTVGYERARGMRAKHQMASGFAVSVNRTIAVPMDRLKTAFTDASIRRRWLPDGALRRRQTRAETSARFDWPEPPSLLIVGFTGKGETKTSVAIQHERLPDQAAADRFKAFWRERVTALKQLLEGQ